MPRTDPAGYREYMREYMTRRYHQRRERVIEQMGGECEWCGSSDRLEIDHRDRRSKDFDLGKRLASAPMDEIEDELEKCRLLCRLCHELKTHGRERGQVIRSPRLLKHRAHLAGLVQLSLFEATP
jgi:5-methylcytosine-specific restriction endonuclease McrA